MKLYHEASGPHPGRGTWLRIGPGTGITPKGLDPATGILGLVLAWVYSSCPALLNGQVIGFRFGRGSFMLPVAQAFKLFR